MKRPTLTYANVVSSIALFAALTTGGAVAADKIGASQIRDNAIKSRHITPLHIKQRHLAPTAVHQINIADDAVTGQEIRSGTVQWTDLDSETRYRILYGTG